MALSMRFGGAEREKVVIDTGVYVDYLRAGLHQDWVLGPASRRVRFLSAVVLFELKLGARTLRSRRVVDALKLAFPSGRLIAPSAEMFERAAILYRKVHGASVGPPSGDRLGHFSDLMIALTSWRIGAAVVTSNGRDFKRIAAHLPDFAWLEP